MDILSTFRGVFMVHCVNAENFLICGFTVRLFCLSPQFNFSETFTRYGYYAGEVEDLQLSRKSLC